MPLSSPKGLVSLGIIALSASLITGCATETRKSIAPETVSSYQTNYHGIKTTLAVGNFDNRSNYNVWHVQ